MGQFQNMMALGILFVIALAGCGATTKHPSIPFTPPVLTWTDNSSGAALTQIERRSRGGFAPLANAPPGVVEYVDATVIAGERYCYRAMAVIGESVSAYSNEACK